MFPIEAVLSLAEKLRGILLHSAVLGEYHE
jgi:hypothetical protein